MARQPASSPVTGSPDPEKDPDSGMSFEEGLAALEAIVGRLESPTVPLDELLVRYEEGMRLLGVCERQLEGARRKVEEVTVRAHQARMAAREGAKEPPSSGPAGRGGGTHSGIAEPEDTGPRIDGEADLF